MKKILALVLALTLALGTFSFAAAAPEDVVGTDYEDAVNKLVYLGIIAGFPDGTYRPAEPVTRAQFAKIIVTALGVGEAAQYAAGATKFADVPADHWATGYINVAADLGIIVGYPDGTFLPENQVSYAEAIKMIVAALGYTPKAEQMGGYPGGYLAIAAEKEISDGVTVINNMAANRGDIALMIDNALTVPMMVQKTWGQYPEYGEDEDQTLMKKLGVDEIEGRVVAIPRVDSKLDDNEIRLGEAEDKADNGVYEVVEGLDVEAAFGNEVTLFVKKDKVLGLTIESDFFIDALEKITDKKLNLVLEDEDYDFAEDVMVWIDGEEEEVKDLKGKEYDYAKVVLDDDDNVVFVDAYVWDGFIVVEEVDDEAVMGYDDELVVEDFTIVKGGKVIALEDVEEGDIFFYNYDAEFAEVYNVSVAGELERVYVDSIKIDGEEYDITLESKYLDGEDLKEFTHTVADDMYDEGGEVEVFVDRFGNVVFVTGDTGEADTSTFYALVLEDPEHFTYRAKDMWTLEVLSETGEDLSYDLDLDVEGTWVTEDENTPENSTVHYLAGDVVEIEVDEDGDVESVDVLGFVSAASASDFETDDSYVDGKKLKGSAVIFDVADIVNTVATGLSSPIKEDDVIVTTLEEYNASEVTESLIVVNNKDEVVVIIVFDSDRVGDEEYDVVLAANPRKVSGEDIYRLDLVVNGVEDTYYTVKKIAGAVHDGNNYRIGEGDFLAVTIDEETNEITDLSKITAANRVETVEIDKLSVSNATFEEKGDATNLFRIKDAVLLDEDFDTIRVRDLENGDKVKVLRVDANSKYVSILLLVEEAVVVDDDGDKELDMTYDSGTVTVTGLVYKDAGDNDYVIGVAKGDTEKYSDVKTLTDADNGELDFTVPTITDAGIYTVTLYNLADVDEPIITKNFYMTKSEESEE